MTYNPDFFWLWPSHLSVLISRLDFSVVVHLAIKGLLHTHDVIILRKPYLPLQLSGMAVSVIHTLNRSELICWKLAITTIKKKIISYFFPTFCLIHKGIQWLREVPLKAFHFNSQQTNVCTPEIERNSFLLEKKELKGYFHRQVSCSFLA